MSLEGESEVLQLSWVVERRSQGWIVGQGGSREQSAPRRCQLVLHSTLLPRLGLAGQLVTLFIKTWKHKPTFCPQEGAGWE